MDLIPDPVLVIGSEERVLIANDSASRWYGKDLTDQLIYAVFRQPEALDCIRRARSLQSEFKTRIFFIKNEITTWFELRTGPVAAPELGIEGVAIHLKDVSEFDDLDQLRREFVANVSHELRSPLTSLSGIIETLRGRTWDDGEAREKFLGLMESETRRMTLLVNDLLSLSKVETEERIRPTDRVNLVAAVRDTLDSVLPLARSLGITMKLNASDDRILVRGDQFQLVQLANNLIENALKYGKRGTEVGLTCSLHDSVLGFDGLVAEFEVRDRGDGIEEFHIPRLTERFYRVDKHRSRAVEGTGLGLAIVKHIVNRHRGRISISSEVGVGSRFSVFLPACGEPGDSP